MKKLLFFLLLSLNCYSQFSKTHYIPPLTCSTNNVQDQYIYISTPSTKDVKFKIIEIGGSIINGIVNANTPYRYDIGFLDNTQLFTPKTAIGIISNKGYIIEADNLIYTSIRVNGSLNNFGLYNHAGGLVSKGNSALGKEFRLGGMLNPLFDPTVLNFASILATENGTNVTLSNIPDGTILTDGFVVNGSLSFTLNKNESYVIALENYNNSVSNSSKIIGALVESDKPVVVNSGSFNGSNSIQVNNQGNPAGRDIGFDQIVPFEKTGKEYIFVKGLGTDELERVILIAHKPQTDIYLNGNSTLFATLTNAGEYLVIDGSQFINGNLYVSTSENVFAYQCIGGSLSPANQNMFFVPPLNCTTPNGVDNIPLIESIGNTIYNGSLNIVTEAGSSVLVNGNPIAALPLAVVGTGGLNTAYERYTVSNLNGNIAVKSTKQVYVSYFGSNNAATYGGYYSGFDTKPEIVSDKLVISNLSCIPNIVLNVSSQTSYDTFEWYFNDVLISNSNSSTYTPTQPGYYQAKGSIVGCSSFFSDKIPVSNCPTDLDNDTVNDAVDLDNDTDGITNCTESYENQSINIATINSGTITVANYSNTFTGIVTTSANISSIPFTGNADGSFISEVPAGKTNWISYKMSFIKPISLGLEYVSNANPTDLLNPDAEYVVKTDIDKTITVLNPNDQLLIDTNYDGIFESGITKYSSFEIRFRLNSAVPLQAGTGTFKFLTYLSNTISITHKNLSNDNPNKSTFHFFASCVPKDSDGDGISNQVDSDSDNDGVPDIIESQSNNSSILANTDTNTDGIDNAFQNGLNPMDTDNDGVLDYLDLDSDNDGILDTAETGNDTDNDGIKNYRDLDSDNDNCNDVIEAGFSDSNGDGLLGNTSPPTININGMVTSGVGYTNPNPNYLSPTPIIITTQPKVNPICELQNSSISIIENGATSFQWQVSTNGTLWNTIINNATYSGVTTKTLTIYNVSNAINGYKYRVQLNRIGNVCGLLSADTTLSIYPLPIVNNVSIVQCDDDLDGFTSFNLTIKNKEITSNFANETITYYTSLPGAKSANPAELIATPLSFLNTIPNTMSVWARVLNSNGCFSVAQITLKVSVTQINATTFHRTFAACDDASPSDIDGISEFNFQSVTTDIQNILPAPNTDYAIKYYKTEADALSEINEITNSTNYRNTTINSQDIWVRIDSNQSNACYGLGSFITLTVNALPKINLNKDGIENTLICSDLPTFFVQLDAGINDGSLPSKYTYVWSKDGRVLLNETSYTLDVNAEGLYSVVVSTIFGCKRTRTLKVTASNSASNIIVKNIDLSDNNTLTITVSGDGNYQFGIDGENGSFQDSNFFTHVAAGIHEIVIIDKNGCRPVSKTISVVGIPNFFTPNNDGFNDFWNVKGLNTAFYPNAIIYIFDRYGKLIKQISGSGQGWDGTLNGAYLPSDDYWYTIKLDDGREAKGNFTLKR